MSNHLGPLIRKIRIARGISINGLATMAGMPGRRANIGRYERMQKNSLRAPECLYPIAEALGTTVPALFVMQEICRVTPLQGEELLSTLDRVQSSIGRIKRAA